MKYGVLTAITLLMVSPASFAQCNFNGGFELWDTIVTPNLKYVKPHGWRIVQGVCHNPTIYNGARHQVYSGESSVLLHNANMEVEPTIILHKFACKDKPRGLGLYALTNSFDGEPFAVEVRLYSKRNEIIADGRFMADSTYYKKTPGLFHKSEIIFNYQINQEIDSIEIKLISGIKEHYNPGSSLILDSIHLIYGSLNVASIDSRTSLAFTIRPNPCNSDFSVYLSKSDLDEEVEVHVFNQFGQDKTLLFAVTRVDPEIVLLKSIGTHLVGIYYVKITTKNGNLEAIEKVVLW